MSSTPSASILVCRWDRDCLFYNLKIIFVNEKLFYSCYNITPSFDSISFQQLSNTVHTGQEDRFNLKKMKQDFWANFLISGIIVVAEIATNNFWDNGPLRKWVFFQFDCYFTDYYTIYYKNGCKSVTFHAQKLKKYVLPHYIQLVNL